MNELSGQQIEQAGAPFYLWVGMLPMFPLADNIREAKAIWREKYGTEANTVIVRTGTVPEMPEGGCVVIEGCQVRVKKEVQAGTLWCGWEARS
jgi:hypothetical protein